MMDAKKLLTTVAGPDGVSNAVKFDGVNDYLARGGALTGVVDSPKGVLSCWLRRGKGGQQRFFRKKDARFDSQFFDGGEYYLSIYNGESASIYVQKPVLYGPCSRWCHVLVAWDFTSTNVQQVFIDDISFATASSPPSYPYSIDLEGSDWEIPFHYVGDPQVFALQHLYFAPGEYLDLSIESNRRRFCDYDASGQLVPVSLGADGSAPTGNQPAIYLPLTDPLSAGLNLGYGGNFTVNGVLEYASTSPDTPSVEAVEYNGADTYLRRITTLSGAVDSNKFIVSMWALAVKNTTARVLTITNGSANVAYIEINYTKLGLYIYDSSGNYIFNHYIYIPAHLRWRINHFLLSYDGDNGELVACLNGSIASATTKPTTDAISFSGDRIAIASSSYIVGQLYNGVISELYFAPGEYLDLSIETNRRKFITADGKPANPRQLHTATGINPAIYLPNPAATVEQNLGYGGDFTRNGTLKDARSTPLYYYAEPATFDGTNDYLQSPSLSLGNKYSGIISCWLKRPASTGRVIAKSSGQGWVTATSSQFQFTLYNTNSHNTVVVGYLPIPAGWSHLLIAFTGTTVQAYVNDKAQTMNTLNTGGGVSFSGNFYIGADRDGTDKFSSDLAEVFICDQHLDLSVEENRRKFITADGRPAGNLIETTGITPAIYLARDYANWHKNLGSGGDFTVNGALARGINSPSDVKEVV